MANVSAIYFPRGRERMAMRASLTPTLTTPHVCLMADPRSLPGLLTICGGLTSRYPITVHRRSFLFIVNQDKARCIAFICTAGHVRRSVLSLSGTRSFPRSCRVFIIFFSPSPPLLFLSLSLFFIDMHCHVVYLIHAKVAECRFNGDFFFLMGNHHDARRLLSLLLLPMWRNYESMMVVLFSNVEICKSRWDSKGWYITTIFFFLVIISICIKRD